MRSTIKIMIACISVAVLVTTYSTPSHAYDPIRWSDNGCGLQPMTISEEGKNFIRGQEKLTLRPYYDHNGYAVGYGMHTWQDRKVTRTWPGTLTPELVEEEFDRQLDRYADIVRDRICAPLEQAMLDGLVSLAWNVGTVNRAILVKVENGSPVRVTDFLTTTKVGKTQSTLLINRRLHEFLLFAGNYQLAMRNDISPTILRRKAQHLSVTIAD